MADQVCTSEISGGSVIPAENITLVNCKNTRFHDQVSDKLNDLYQLDKLSPNELDERALKALEELPLDSALAVLSKFLECDLDHVSNKSAYLCGLMKSYKQNFSFGKTKFKGEMVQQQYPNEERINALLERTGYSLDVTTGQRKYGGPPPGWNGPAPGNGCEVYCGSIPKDLYEDTLIPQFENCGHIWEFRLMMDSMSGLNRGYAFVKFNSKEEAFEAVRQLNSFEIVDGKRLQVKLSVPNTRLFVGNIPKTKSKEEIFIEFERLSDGLVDVITYSSPDDMKLNRGFCFLEYDSHNAASLAKKWLGTKKMKVWGCEIIVDWADPQEDPDDEVMSHVKVLYCRNLPCWVTEDNLKDSFEKFGCLERVKKIKNYAFVHFEARENAVKAMNDLDKQELFGIKMEISLAKPPSDKRNKENILRKREQRMMQTMVERMTYPTSPSFPVYGSRWSGPTRRVYHGHAGNSISGDENVGCGGWKGPMSPLYQYTDNQYESYQHNGSYRARGQWRDSLKTWNPRYGHE